VGDETGLGNGSRAGREEDAAGDASPVGTVSSVCDRYREAGAAVEVGD
jgi:hypothetical protein